jgi:hypothetical protein
MNSLELQFVTALNSPKSGRGLPQSKTWRNSLRSSPRDSVLDCASPLALSIAIQRSSNVRVYPPGQGVTFG